MKMESVSPNTGVQPKAAEAATRLEQAFLEEMLKYCGPRPSDGSFSGGHGEEQFTSFLTQEYAALMAGRLQTGLRLQAVGAAT
ncbi:rod-binding protein [Paracoccus sp. (in: a-proteobacteria)]|uniref:rod-binding protein n=1 Tax=Paracoccus sp. TaxID=267 RepID=UPI003A89E312